MLPRVRAPHYTAMALLMVACLCLPRDCGAKRARLTSGRALPCVCMAGGSTLLRHAGATNPQYALQLTPGAFFAGATCNMTLSFMQASGCDASYPLAAFNSSVPALVAPTGQPRSCTVVFSPHGFRSEGYTLVVELAPTSSVSGGTYGKTMNVSLPHGGPPQVLVAGLASSVQPVVVQVQNDGESTCCLAAGAQDRQWPSIAQACTPLGAGDTMLLDGPLVRTVV